MYLKRPSASHGFTLLELLIAIAVFAVMSVMAYGGLSNVIDNSKSSRLALSRLQEVQHALFNIERDISQIATRSIRDEFGDVKSYLTAGNDIDRLIEFTRGGRRNPARILRSNLLRVAYRLDNGNLSRLYWPQLDRVQGMEPVETMRMLARYGNADVVTMVNPRPLQSIDIAGQKGGYPDLDQLLDSIREMSA